MGKNADYFGEGMDEAYDLVRRMAHESIDMLVKPAHCILDHWFKPKPKEGTKP